MKQFRFNIRYFLFAVLLFVVEVLIALYVHDRIVRPYIGDLLLVILIYCFCKSFLNLPVLPLALGVLLFSYAIELLQYFDLVGMLGLEHSRLARIILGSSFEFIDLVAYTVGIGLLLLAERTKLAYFPPRKDVAQSR